MPAAAVRRSRCRSCPSNWGTSSSSRSWRWQAVLLWEAGPRLRAEPTASSRPSCARAGPSMPLCAGWTGGSREEVGRRAGERARKAVGTRPAWVGRLKCHTRLASSRVCPARTQMRQAEPRSTGSRTVVRRRDGSARLAGWRGRLVGTSAWSSKAGTVKRSESETDQPSSVVLAERGRRRYGNPAPRAADSPIDLFGCSFLCARSRQSRSQKHKEAKTAKSRSSAILSGERSERTAADRGLSSTRTASARFLCGSGACA